jgi:HEAT repeat protein
MPIRPPLLGLLLAAALAGHAAAEEAPSPKEERRPADGFLLDWVQGRAIFEWGGEFRSRFPESPHREDSERFEVAMRCLTLRKECGDERARALVDALLALLRAKGTEGDRRLRTLLLLGWTQDPRSVPALAAETEEGVPECRAEALEALGFFGKGVARALFGVYGGRIRAAFFPPRPAGEATQVLVERTRALRAAVSASPEDDTALRLRFVVLYALQWHEGPEVAALAREGLDGKDPCLGGDGRAFGDLLARNAGRIPLEALLAAREDGNALLRSACARALGFSASREAVPALLEALADPEKDVAGEADAGLSRLAGIEPERVPFEGPDPAKRRALWSERLGPRGERMEPEKAIRFVDREPGIY